MILLKIFVVTLIVSPSFAYRRQSHRWQSQEVMSYAIPEPLVEVCNSGGFRVSIPDQPGIQIFAFHGKINDEFHGLEAGTFFQDILGPEHGRWTFVNNDAQLNRGDCIHYWLFVQHEKLGYRLGSKKFIVNEKINCFPNVQTSGDGVNLYRPYPGELPHVGSDYHHHHHYQHIPNPYYPSRQPGIYPNPYLPYPQPPSPTEESTTLCTAAQLNEIKLQLEITNKKLFDLQNLTDTLKKDLSVIGEVLTEILDVSQIGTKLVLIGPIMDTNYYETVKVVVTDKLGLHDLQTKILNAIRNEQGIVFEVQTVSDKIRILARSKDRLKTSKFKVKDWKDQSIIAHHPVNETDTPDIDVRFGE